MVHPRDGKYALIFCDMRRDQLLKDDTTGWLSKALRQVKEDSKYYLSYNLIYEMSRKSKSVEIESRLVVAWNWL